ncbi:MAG: hypothetical protein AVO38_01430 [delta proteobacterium ML8_D]|nr:MAG: hypothetical protein AVO38_01430 [delta proteobacterium ML8_D]
MPINEYEEKEIRNKILNKIEPKILSDKSKYHKGLIELDHKIVARVKIPNDHHRIMKSRKSQFIATALRLNHEEFNSLIDCPLTGPKYYNLLRKKLIIK